MGQGEFEGGKVVGGQWGRVGELLGGGGVERGKGGGGGGKGGRGGGIVREGRGGGGEF